MVSQCLNLNCENRYQPVAHDGFCSKCRHVVVSTPDYGGSPPGALPVGLISGSMGSFAYASPANTGSNHDSPAAAGYSPSAGSARNYRPPGFAFNHPPAGHGSTDLHSVSARPSVLSSHNGVNSDQTTHANHHHDRSLPMACVKPIQPITGPKFVPYQYDSKQATSHTKNRSCVPCYKRHQTCKNGPDDKFCQSCVGKKYCKGVIESVGFLDMKPCFQAAARLMKLSSEESLLNIAIGVNKHIISNDAGHLPAENFVPEPFHLDLGSLRGGSITENDHSKWAQVLDAVFHSTQTSTPRLTDGKFFDPAPLERLCRQFVAALLTIRNITLCTVDSHIREKRAAPYVVLEILQQLSAESDYLYREIFKQFNDFVDARRPAKKPETYELHLAILGRCLGQMYGALERFGSKFTDQFYSCPTFSKICQVTDESLAQLVDLGRYFSVSDFRKGADEVPTDLQGIHIMHSTPGQLLHNEVKVYPKGSMTFLEVIERHLDSDPIPVLGDARLVLPEAYDQGQASGELQDSLFHENADVILATMDYTSPIIDKAGGQAELERLQLALRELTEQYSATKCELEDKIQYWEFHLGHDPLSANISSKTPSQSADGNPSVPESNTLVEQEESPVFEALDNARVADESLKMLPSLHPPHESMPSVGAITNSPMLEHKSEHFNRSISINEEDSVSITKRKGSSVFFSMKKARIAEIMRHGQTLSTDDDTIMTEASHDSEPIAMMPDDPTTSNVPTKKRISRILTEPLSFITGKSPARAKIPPCDDTTSEMPMPNAGTSRPSSWPRALRWRKSIGISVKTLRDNFEKMTVERPDPLPSRPIK